MKKLEYKITKTHVECYKFRNTGGTYWADIAIDTTPEVKAGRISISSDFGNWSYFWGGCGSPFKKFLASLDQHYVAGKFGADKFFDAAATIAAYKAQVDQYYKKKSANYRNVMAQISAMESTCSFKDDFVHFLSSGEGNLIMSMYDGCPDLCTSLDPGFKNFWEQVWPDLLQQLAKEESETITSAKHTWDTLKDTDRKRIMDWLDNSANAIWAFPADLPAPLSGEELIQFVLKHADKGTYSQLKDFILKDWEVNPLEADDFAKWLDVQRDGNTELYRDVSVWGKVGAFYQMYIKFKTEQTNNEPAG